MLKHIAGCGKDSSCGVYGLGVIGALVYYLTHVATFSAGLIGIFKAIFWPAFFVYKALELFKI